MYLPELVQYRTINKKKNIYITTNDLNLIFVGTTCTIRCRHGRMVVGFITCVVSTYHH